MPRMPASIKADPSLAVLMGDMFGPNMKEPSQKPVSEVMSPIRVTVNGDDPITKALFLMIQENVGMMPVLLDKKVVGMVRMNELFKEISDCRPGRLDLPAELSRR